MAEEWTLGKVLREAQLQLAAISEDPSQEVRILAEWAFAMSRLDLVIREHQPVKPSNLAAFRAALVRRLEGEPVFRIIGSRPFRGLNLAMSADTLEPRPDTEALVDLALSQLAAQDRLQQHLSILDLGTGTGAIGLAMLAELPDASAVLTDISAGALKTARENAAANNFASRAQFLESNWFDAVSGRFDLIMSNPPYIPSAIIAELDIEVRNHDPLRALDGGPDGLDPYRVIARDALAHLQPAGLVAVEIGHDQAAPVTAIFEAAGYRLLELRKDLGGRDRALAFASQ